MNDEFDAIYRAHVDAVFRYALRMTGDRELAADITSEAFLELFRNRDAIDTSRLPAWLLTVARNRALDHWRKAANERQYIESIRQTATRSDTVGGLESWLRDEPLLKPVHRVCLVLH